VENARQAVSPQHRVLDQGIAQIHGEYRRKSPCRISSAQLASRWVCIRLPRFQLTVCLDFPNPVILKSPEWILGMVMIARRANSRSNSVTGPSHSAKENDCLPCIIALRHTTASAAYGARARHHDATHPSARTFEQPSSCRAQLHNHFSKAARTPRLIFERVVLKIRVYG